jgi:hypothetical protein
MISFLAANIITLFLPSVVMSSVPTSERQALVELFGATDGMHWKNATNWLNGDPCENKWFGIFCNANDTHVLEVFPNPRYSGNRMQGTIPASFWKDLPRLEHIYLSNDRPPGWSNLTGHIPSSIGNLTRLKCLYLSHAGNMTGTLPSSMSKLINLQGLFLRWTNFEGLLPDLSKARNLSKIVIDSSPIDGLCPNICKNRFNGTLNVLSTWDLPLTHLDVAGNDFSGTFPKKLCQIKKCTAWGNHFSLPSRPKNCCAGIDGGISSVSGNNIDDMDDMDRRKDVGITPVVYECHAHKFPRL